MGKGILYALPRSAQRHERADYERAIQLFQSQGQYEGDPVLTAHVVTYCFDRRVPFKWDVPGSGADGVSRVVRV